MPTQQSMARDDAVNATRFPIRLLTIAMVLTTVAFAWFGWFIFDLSRDAKIARDHSTRMEELRGVIRHFGEVLGGSVRLAVTTGDLKWEERYRRFEPPLGAAIDEVKGFAVNPSSARAAAQTDEANILLVKMENHAFALVRAGRMDEAHAVIFSPEYEKEEQIYAQGITSFIDQIRRDVDERERRDKRIDFFSMIGALVVLAISFAAWLSVVRGLQRWRTDLEQAVSERTQAEQALRRANDESEVRVTARTAELGKTNQALQAEITERKQAEKALRASEERFRIAAETANDVVYEWDLKQSVQWLGKIDEMLGYEPGEFPRTLNGWAASVHPEDLERTMAAIQAHLEGRVPFAIEYRVRRKDGVYRWWSARGAVARTPDGKPTRWIGSITDFTERKQAEEALRQSEEQLRAMFELASVGIAQADPHTGQWLRVNKKMCEITGYSVGELLQKRIPDITYPEDRQPDREAFERVVRGEAPDYRMEKRYIRKDGALAWVNVNMTIIRDAAGQPTRTMAVIEDITERKRVETDLIRLAAIIESSDDAIISKDLNSSITSWNKGAEKLFGYTASEMMGTSIMRLIPADRQDEENQIREKIRRGEKAEPFETLRQTKDGRLIDVSVTASPIKDATGKVIGVSKAARDITERKHLEAQLIQSQKLETVGKLAGGVAHEFNSILTAIIGQSELLLNELPPGDPLCKNATEISQAADRAATLTRQLLAYGRKQILQPEILDLNSVLAGMASTLGHLMGRGADVRIVPAGGLKAVKADAGQIEQVIMNMAMNAADAMPNGGNLTLETTNVTLEQEYVSRFPELKAGDYVMLAITDTGTGMSEKAMARVFEPFFSTKGVGQGTGLGLSTCYGIIKQSGGHISVYSEPGRGTAFKIYLPQVEPQTKIPIQRLDSPDLPRGTETILLVEDDPALREMAATLLRRLGYTVFAAANGIEALSLKQQRDNGHIDLLFTDVVMPHMNGKELSDRVRMLFPQTKILFTSAYTESAVVHQGALNPGVELLQKPFTPSALALKVREVLDQPSAQKPGTARKTFGLMEIPGGVTTP